jgi:hypothetical protein
MFTFRFRVALIRGFGLANIFAIAGIFLVTRLRGAFPFSDS